MQASGRWVNDRTHGVHLASGMIKGIGPIYAKKLVKAFREQVFDVIEQQPERLQEVDGIGPKRADSIVAAWADQKAIREIVIFLHSHGVGTSPAKRIYKTHGGNTIRICFAWTCVMSDAEVTWFENHWRTQCKDAITSRHQSAGRRLGLLRER